MLKFFFNRLAWAIPVLLFIATATFFMIRLAPGGPFDQDKKVPVEILKNLNAKYHLDWPLPKQYFQYIGPFNLDEKGAGIFGGDGTSIFGGVLSGDLGPSFRYANRSVNEIIAVSFPVSVELGLLALIFALLVGITAGVTASLNPGTWKDNLFMGGAMTGIAIPNFVMGPLLVLVFALWLGWLNVSGWYGPEDRVLPAITLGAPYAAYIARLTRGGMMEILRQDFIRTAHAKGLSPGAVVYRHAIRGGILPTVSFLGPALAGIATGSLVVETIFDIPGLGRFFVQSGLNRDYTMVMGTALFYAGLIIFLNIIVDVVYALLDPRVKYD